MKAQILKWIRNAFVLVLGSALVGILLLTLVFALPAEPVRRNVLSDVPVMMSEEIPEGDFLQYVYKNKESFTDAIMVQNALEDIEGKTAYEHAVWAYHRDLGDEVVWQALDTLKALGGGADASEMYLRTYARYWHGYLMYLKPLLMIFSWQTIVYIGIAVQLLLLAAVIWLAVKKRTTAVPVALAVGMLFMKPVLMHVSLTMSVCWVITLVALLLQMWRHGWLEEKKMYGEFFLCVGIATAYFDFLTYPLVTLGVPLCIYFLMSDEKGIGKRIGHLAINTIGWGIGYIGMWAMKWIISDVTLQTGTIRDAVWNVIGRTEAIGGRPRFNGAFYVMGINLQEYFLPIYSVLAIVLAIAVVVLVVLAARKGGVKTTLAMLVPYLLIAISPFVWITVVQHHCALHARFTFRIIALTAMAFACVGVECIRVLRNTDRKND
ncbi:MAG: hypothetical protein IJB84_07525 [Lachnospiraceae bacterium]|nr:hypothetical protein [Lachnospiraceae bacterium]